MKLVPSANGKQAGPNVRSMLGLLVMAGVLVLPAACGADEDPDEVGDDRGTDVDADPDETWDLRFTTFFGPQSPYQLSFDRYKDRVEERTDGRVQIEVLSGGALLSGPDTLSGIGDGRADMGYTIESFHHAELPLSSLASVPFITSNATAHMRTFHELYERHEDFRAEWDNMNVRVLYYPMGTPSMLGTIDDVAENVDDISGLRIRALGFINDAIASVGGLPQPVPIEEMYESVQRGLLDGYTLQFDLIGEAGLTEVAPYIADVGLGQYVLPSISINMDVWNTIPEDIQEIMLEAGLEAMDEMPDDITDAGELTCQGIEEQGGEVAVWDEAAVAEWRDAVFDDLLENWKEQANQAGLDAEGFYDDFISTLRSYEDTETYVDPLHECADRL